MSKSKENIFGIIKTVSIVFVFLMSLLAMFLPYSLEIFLGLAIIGFLGYAVTYILQFKQNPLWETIISVLLPLISIVLTIVLSFFGCVFNEFIILLFCGLHIDTHNQISERASSSLETEMIKMDDEVVE